MRLLPLVAPGPPLTREQVQRYSRHLLLAPLGDLGQRRLLAARVLVMGAGGLGSPALQYLAAAGVGHVGIVDDDVVEASNLQRQVIHSLADVGRPKVDSAAEQIAALNPEVQVVRHHLRLDATNAHEILGGYDLVLDGTDNFPTRYLVNDVCAELGIPLIWGSILRFDAQVAVFWSRPRTAAAGADGGPTEATRTPDGGPTGPTRVPDGGPTATGRAENGPAGVTLRDLFPTPPPEGTTPSCGQAGVLGAMCGQVGSIMAAEAVKLLTGAGETLLGRVLVLDVLAARWSELPVRPRTGAHAPSTVAELGYDPAGSPAGSPAAALCTVPDAPAASAVAPTPAPGITVRSLAARLAARERGADDFVLLDVREVPERSIVTIPGAVSIPLAEVLADPETAVHRLDLGRPGGVARELVVHCRSGQRSAQAVRALTDAGARAINVKGGVLAWVADVDPTLPTY